MNYDEMYNSIKKENRSSGEHRHHYRLKNDSLRDDNEWIYCTLDEHIELHRLMYEENPCRETHTSYCFIKGWKSPKGVKRSEETIEKLSISGKGKHCHTEEMRKKISDSLIGRKRNYTTFKMTCKNCGGEFISASLSRRYCDSCKKSL